MLTQPLNKQSTITPSKSSQKYFIYRYNYVIAVYNQTHPDIKLCKLDENKFFMTLNSILTNNLAKILLLLILVFVPIINIILMGILWFYLFFIIGQIKKHKQNLARVDNPLKDFLYLPQICNNMQKHHTSLSLDIADLEGFTFNRNLSTQLKDKFLDQKTNKINVVIYDEYFYDSFHSFGKQRYKISLWIVVSTICICISALFYLFLFDLY